MNYGVYNWYLNKSCKIYRSYTVVLRLLVLPQAVSSILVYIIQRVTEYHCIFGHSLAMIRVSTCHEKDKLHSAGMKYNEWLPSWQICTLHRGQKSHILRIFINLWQVSFFRILSCVYVCSGVRISDSSAHFSLFIGHPVYLSGTLVRPVVNLYHSHLNVWVTGRNICEDLPSDIYERLHHE